MSETKIRVLIVDDDPDQLALTERSLSSYNFEVRTHRSSLGVSNLVRTTAPDLVLLDVNIPALSGDKVLALAAGADGYLSKSTQGADLARKLERLHKRPRAAAGT